jgi:GNAT superfamily N-acetyltransferase
MDSVHVTEGAPPWFIRAATPTDAPALAQLRYQFRSELGTPTEPEPVFVVRAADWFAAHLVQGEWRAWVASDGADRLIGHLFAHLQEKIPNPLIEAETIVYFTNFYVVPAWRSQGIGEQLMQAAFSSLRELAIDTAILWPSARSTAFYQRIGFATPPKLLELPWHVYQRSLE